jgi:hypothetical protein
MAQRSIEMNAHETALALARSDLAEAVKDPKMTGRGLMVFRTAIETAEAQLMLDAHRAEAAAELKAEQAKAAAEAQEVEAAAMKAAEKAEAVAQAAMFDDALATARNALETLLAMPGVPHGGIGLEIVVVRAARHHADSVAKSQVFDVPAAIGLPSKIEAARIAVAKSNQAAEKAARQIWTDIQANRERAAKEQHAKEVASENLKGGALRVRQVVGSFIN